MTSSQVEWSQNDEVGNLCIMALSEHTKFVPEYQSQDFMYKLISYNNENRTLQNLNSLVHRLTEQLSCLKESNLPLGQAKTQMLKQCNMAGVNPNVLPKTFSSLC